VQAFVKNEFVLHYQPKLNLITQKITGVEALLRWQSEQYGLVAPNEIIHLAEESGLIIPLNEWVLKTAVKQVKAWHAEGLCPLTVAINLSSRQFKQANLSDSILHALDEVGFSPDSVEMEVTESLIMQDPDLVLNSLQALKQQGISIAIDDFGTGYSSLEYIRRFSMDTVKIDKKFIHQMTKDSVSASIVSAIIAMANKLGIKTTAEGVETREQYDLLLKEKCTEIQGFYLSKPLDAEKMGLFLKDPLVISALTNLSKMSD